MSYKSKVIIGFLAVLVLFGGVYFYYSMFRSEVKDVKNEVVEIKVGNDRAVKTMTENKVRDKMVPLVMKLEQFYADSGKFPKSWDDIKGQGDDGLIIDENTGKNFVFEVVKNGEEIRVCTPDDNFYKNKICVP